jgi:hypothetical protein
MSHELVTVMIDNWIENQGSQPDLNLEGVNLYAGASFSMRMSLIPLVMSHIKTLDAKETISGIGGDV